MEPALTPSLLLHAYASGVFPMAEDQDSPDVFWVDPTDRGIVPLSGFHISRSLRRRILRTSYTISTDRDFAGVVRGCADRKETWINQIIFDLYQELHHAGYAHSLEVWDGEDLIGGVYGIALGGAFFGESMFSRKTDASKIALAYLVDRLNQGGFSLFDTQFITPHLASLGGLEISRKLYRQHLAQALNIKANFDRQGAVPSAYSVIQRNTQTS